jgi:hypothetical protein
MGLGDFFEGVKDAAVNVGKGAAWAVNPTHWDDIAEGVGKGVEFVAEHPGKAWDTAFEVGRAVVKDQLDPVNLAINAGLIAATVATGGAAAPAFIAKMGLTAKSAEAGLSAVKAIDTVGDVAKAASTATKAVEAGSTALKAADTAGDVARGVRTGAKALDVAGDVAKTADTVTDAARTGSKAMQLVDKGLGLGEKGKWMTRAQKAINPLETSEKFGAAAYRERAAMRMLEAGGEAPSVARQAAAAFVQGGGKGLGMAKQLPGMSDKVYEAQKWAQRAQAAGKRLHQADQLGRGVEVAADPMSAVADQATDYVNSTTHAAGYTDRGQTTESLYGNSSQVATPPGGGRGGPPSSRTGSGAVPPSDAGQVTENLYGMDEATSQAAASSHRGMHFWEGPRSQWAGGIKANHDWRPVDPLRPIRTQPGTTRTTYNDAVDTADTAGAAPSDRYMGDLNEQGAPKNFSPEVPKSGMYALSAGQQPIGSVFPATRMGEGQRTRHNLTNVNTLSQPIGAIGPGAKRTGNAVIDADSSSPDDIGFDNAGQGYFNFANMGSGTADVGMQPNTSPMYSQGSRTSRRSTGMLGV